MTYNGTTLYTAKDGEWRVGVRTQTGAVAITDPNKYASEASAFLAAKQAHEAKPFMSYSVVRA
jgi:uncharacterized protein YegP (UPF0339 family)